MSESEPDPREYRGGVRETEEAKGGENTWADTEGVVPREMIDDLPPQDESDPQTQTDDYLGEVTGEDSADVQVDTHAGDEADATKIGGTGADVEDLEEGRPISRVDQVDLAQRTDEV